MKDDISYTDTRSENYLKWHKISLALDNVIEAYKEFIRIKSRQPGRINLRTFIYKAGVKQ